MADLSGVTPEDETPVNPYSLLEAVNRSSDTAHAGWLIFLAIMTYFMIAVAGVTHRDLLLETPVSLPMLQVDIPITQFFQFAPVILVLLHLGLISQLALLARKTLEFDHAIRLLEATDKRTHPLRLELNNFFFVQAIAGPQRSATMGAFLHGLSWLTLVVLPVVLILYIQVVFLPYHDVWVTWTHRIALVVDLAALILIGVFLFRAETSFFLAFFRTTTSHPFSFLATCGVLGSVALFSFFVATVPGETLDRIMSATLRPLTGTEDAAAARQAGGYAMPFFGGAVDGALFGIFRRNIYVTDTDLVVDKDQTPGEPSFTLRGRDLRYARLDRSDLHQVDLTNADLEYASFIETNLENAWLNCADTNSILVNNDRAKAKCSVARKANLSRAKLKGARLVGIDLSGASLADADLVGADLSYARLVGADFLNARLEKADLTGGVQAQGTSFLLARMQGADLSWAQLQNADLSNADLQGAILKNASLHGALLRDSDLKAGSLQQAKLYGADLSGLTITAADLRGAEVWMTNPPETDPQALADFSEAVISPLSDDQKAELEKKLAAITDESVRSRVKEAVAPVLDQTKSGDWENSAESARWAQLVLASPSSGSDIYPRQLTSFLTDQMCMARYSNGSLATGIVRRAKDTEFRGDLILVHDRLLAKDCAVSKAVLPSVFKEFVTVADSARSAAVEDAARSTVTDDPGAVTQTEQPVASPVASP